LLILVLVMIFGYRAANVMINIAAA